MTKFTNTALSLSSLALLALTSGCAIEASNDQAPLAIAQMKSARLKPILDISEKKVSAQGEAGGFFNFDIVAPESSNYSTLADPAVFIGLTPTEAQALREAIFNACEANTAEYLLTPHFKIRTREFPILNFMWRKSYCVVSGIPAKVKSVVQVDDDEAMVDLHLSAVKKESEQK